MKVICRNLEQDEKCGGCNWETSTTYSFESNDIYKEGLCTSCFMDMIIENHMEIIPTGV
jgi:hypothetical protein